MKISKDQYYMGIARAVSVRSSCAKRQVGAVIVLDDRVVSTGYNGTPRGMVNCDAGGCARCCDTTVPSGEHLNECVCCHAEENAIAMAAFHGVAIRDSAMYTLMSPCLICAKLIVNSGIVLVNYEAIYPQNGLSLLGLCGVYNELVRR